MNNNTINNSMENKQFLTLKNLIIFGMVTMAPLAPWQVYGMVSNNSFGMVPLIYAIGVFLMLCTASSYAQMSKEFPYSGSIYSYVQRGINPHVGFLAGWTLLADYLLAPGLLYLFAGLWMSGMTPIPPLVWSVIFLILNTLINIRGITISSKVNLYIFWLQLVSLIIFSILSIKYIFIENLGAGGFSIDPLFQSDNINLTFIGTAISIIVLGFLGFDGISTMAEETKNPKLNIGKATIWSLLLTGVIFIFQTYLAALVIPQYQNLDQDMALFEIATEVGGPIYYSFMIIVNVLAVGIAVTLNIQTSVSRILYSMGKDEILPGSRFLRKSSTKYNTPVNAILLSSLIAMIVLTSIKLESVLLLINFGAVTSFIVLNITVIYYYVFKMKKRGFHSFFLHIFLPIVGVLVCGYVWLSFDTATYIFGIGWIVLGTIIGLVKSKGYSKTSPIIKEL